MCSVKTAFISHTNQTHVQDDVNEMDVFFTRTCIDVKEARYEIQMSHATHTHIVTESLLKLYRFKLGGQFGFTVVLSDMAAKSNHRFHV